MRHELLLPTFAALLLAFGGGAQAVTFTVGDDEPGADYRTIQEGIDAALATAGFREVRVAAGRYRENLRLDLPPRGGILYLTGGWGPTFRTRSLDPAATVVSGGGTDRVLYATCRGGSLRIESITLTEGAAPIAGGALLTAGDSCTAVLALATCTGRPSRSTYLPDPTGLAPPSSSAATD